MEDAGFANNSEDPLSTKLLEKQSLQGSGPNQNISQCDPSLNSDHHISPVKCVSSSQPASSNSVETAAYLNSSTQLCQEHLPTSGTTEYLNRGYQSREHYYEDENNYGTHDQYSDDRYKDTPQETYNPNAGQYSQHPKEYYDDTRYRSYPYDTDSSQNPTVGYNTDRHGPTGHKHMDDSNQSMADSHHVSQVTPVQSYTDPLPNAVQRKEWDSYARQQPDYSSNRTSEGDCDEYSRSYYPERQSYNQSEGKYDYEQYQYYENRNYPDSNFYNRQSESWHDERDSKWDSGHYSETAPTHNSYDRYAGYSPNSQTQNYSQNSDASSSSHENSRYSRPPRIRSSHRPDPRRHRGSGRYQDDSHSSQSSDHDYPPPSSHSFNSDRQRSQQYSPRSRGKVTEQEYHQPHEDPRRKKTEDPKILDSREDSESNKHYTTPKSSAASSSFMQKRAAILKQAEGHKQGKPSKGPPIIQPHHVSDTNLSKDKKNEKTTSAEASFPKRSLENFKIPKRKSATVSPVKKATSIPALGLTDQNEPKQEPVKATLSSPLLDESRILKTEKKKTKGPKVCITLEEKAPPVDVPPTSSNVLPTVLSSFNSSTLRVIAAAIQKTLDEAKAEGKLSVPISAPIVSTSTSSGGKTYPISSSTSLLSTATSTSPVQIMSAPILSTKATTHSPPPPSATLSNVSTSLNSVSTVSTVKTTSDVSISSAVKPPGDKHVSPGIVLATILPSSSATKSSQPPMTNPPLKEHNLASTTPLSSVKSEMLATGVNRNPTLTQTAPSETISSLMAKLCGTLLPLATACSPTRANKAVSSNKTTSSSKLETSGEQTVSNTSGVSTVTNGDSKNGLMISETKKHVAESPSTSMNITETVTGTTNEFESPCFKRPGDSDHLPMIPTSKRQKLDDNETEMNCTTSVQGPNYTTPNNACPQLTNSTASTFHENMKSQVHVQQAVSVSHSNSEPSSSETLEDNVSQTYLSTLLPYINNHEKMTSRRRSPTKKLQASQPSSKVVNKSICFFCHKKDCELNLGFLYGPYMFNVQQETKHLTTDTSSHPDKETQTALWFHEDCLVWTPAVCLVGGQLIGLTETVCEAEKMTCVCCKEKGATLFCCSHNCKSGYHYHCARDSGCSFKLDQFLISCPKHSTKNNKRNL